jgi:DNA-binding NtrC family response regulator
MVVAGTFRKDLMFRLRRLEVFIQPLREHAEDIVPLAAHFLAEGRTDERQPTISPEAAAVLRRYAWPGNVRELRNEAERLRLMNSEKLAYDLADLHPRIRGETPESAAEAMAGPPAVPAPQSSLGPSAGEGFRIGRSAMRQLDELRQLFRQKEKLTRVEVYLNLGVSTGTATRYLRLLMTEGLIEKVMPNASPRTHYFRLRG